MYLLLKIKIYSQKNLYLAIEIPSYRAWLSAGSKMIIGDAVNQGNWSLSIEWRLVCFVFVAQCKQYAKTYSPNDSKNKVAHGVNSPTNPWFSTTGILWITNKEIIGSRDFPEISKQIFETLRQFPFTFYFYPRSEPEAIMVKKQTRPFFVFTR